MKLTACNDAILGDLGRFPMYIYSQKRCIKYWLRLINLPDDRYCKMCYNMLLHFHNRGHNNWVTSVRNNLYTNGFGYVWESQGAINQKLFILQYVQKLKEQHLQLWHNRCIENTKLNYYVLYKTTFSVETYVSAIDINKFRQCFANFRSAAHDLMIEKGRHFNLHRDQRQCPYCETDIEDEYHMFSICPLYHDLRLKYLPNYSVQHPSDLAFCSLMSSDSVKLIRNISMYLYYAFKIRSDFMAVYN